MVVLVLMFVDQSITEVKEFYEVVLVFKVRLVFFKVAVDSFLLIMIQFPDG